MRAPRIFSLFALSIALVSPRAARASWPPDGVELQGARLAYTQTQILREAPGVLVSWVGFRQGNYNAFSQRMTDQGEVPPGWTEARDGVENQELAFQLDGLGGHYVAGPQSFGDIALTHHGPTGALAPGWPRDGWPLTSSTLYGLWPQLVADGIGGVIVSWTREDNWTVRSLRLKRVNPSGAGSPGWPANGIVVVSGTAGSALWGHPALVSDGQSGAYFVWLSDRVRVHHATASGALDVAWPSGGLALGAPPFPSVPALHPSGSDHLIARWAESVTQPGGAVETRLMAQRLGADGATDPAWPADGRVVYSTGGTVSHVTSFPDASGGFIFVWTQETPVWSVRALRVLASGDLAPGWAGSGVALLPPGTAANSRYEVASDEAGGLFIVWEEGTRPDRLLIRRILGDGQPSPAWAPGGEPVYSATAHGHLGSVAGDGDAGAYVVWVDEQFTTDGNMNHPLRLKRVIPASLVSVPGQPARRGRPEILSVAPNPAGTSLSVRLELVSEAGARLELVDLAGRRVRGIDVAGSGERSVRFEDLGDVPAGLYFVRLGQAGRTLAARVAIVH